MPCDTTTHSTSVCADSDTSVDSDTPRDEEFLADALEGLQAERKWLPSKYFYDQRGSQLFDQICELEEYYPTRTEIAIMHDHAAEMAQAIGSHAMLIELGSGSSIKTGWLLKEIERPLAYVPVDISGDHLYESAERIAEEFEDVEVLPLHADFAGSMKLPECETEVHRRVVYFPGSTIGNFRPHDARELLHRLAKLVGEGGGLLIGFDLVKSTETLEAAYNDSQGVTAAFNLNLLERMNAELGSDFAVDQFRHQAIYNAKLERIEMHLVSLQQQRVRLGDKVIEFERGETIRTELSHKYRKESFCELAADAGFAQSQVWTDSAEQFAVAYFTVPSA